MITFFEYRIYPTKEQEDIFNQILGLSRLYWNINVLNREKDHSFSILGYKATFEKYKPDALCWVHEISCSAAINQVAQDLFKAYNNFFKSCKNERKGDFIKPPRLKSKKNFIDSFRYPCTSRYIRLDNEGLYVTRKLGHIKIKASCRFCKGKWKNITFKRTATGKWFVKICVDKKEEPKNTNGKVIGLDWNCRDEEFLVGSNGMKVKCPRFLKRASAHLKYLQEIMSRRYDKKREVQSKNYEKAKLRVAKLQEKIAWQRRDWLHKESRRLCNEFETIVVEDINLRDMIAKNHGKVIGDQGFGMLRKMIAYKGNLVKVNPKNTSRICSNCGYLNEEVVLGINNWTCPNCLKSHDRDINSAINILSKYINKKE